MTRYSLNSTALSNDSRSSPRYAGTSNWESQGLRSLLLELEQRQSNKKAGESGSESSPSPRLITNDSISSSSSSSRSRIKPWINKRNNTNQDKPASLCSFANQSHKDRTVTTLARYSGRASSSTTRNNRQSEEDGDSTESKSENEEDEEISDEMEPEKTDDDDSSSNEGEDDQDLNGQKYHDVKLAKNREHSPAANQWNMLSVRPAPAVETLPSPPQSSRPLLLSLPPIPENTKRIAAPPEPPASQRPCNAPSMLARSKMAARPNLAHEAALFKQIEARHLCKLGGDTSSAAGPTTKLWSQPGTATLELAPTSSRLPSQRHIQDATRRSWELLQKKNANANAKRARDQASARPSSSSSSSSKRVKVGEPNTPPPNTPPPSTPPPTKAPEKEGAHTLPISSTRTVVQYTVFETQRLPLPFDGQLRDKVLRRETFLDKNKANRYAARLMPKPENVQSLSLSRLKSQAAAITRIECDYGMAGDAERDGMFLGRVHYGSTQIKFVYVDRELQQLGTLRVADLEAEVGQRDLQPAYVQAFLAARYDVFVVLQKAIQPEDGRISIYEYDETGAEREPQAGETVEKRPCLGSHFEHVLQGSYTTLAEANRKALDAFDKWTRPPQGRPRLDAVIYHRDYLQPDIEQRRRALAEADDSTDSINSENAEAHKRDVESVELSWEPAPQFGYNYSLISVVVTKSQMEGPLDLTGAFA